MTEETETGNGFIKENGAERWVPYQMIKEVYFSDIKKDELVDEEHAARLQYRLLLFDAVIRASVEFETRKIAITYNPEEAKNRMGKISREKIIEFLAKEGVHVSQESSEEKDIDYYTDVYSCQYNPPSVREHQPYGYDPAEWTKMKSEYERKKAKWETEKESNFKEWQRKYLLDHPDLAAKLGANPGQ